MEIQQLLSSLSPINTKEKVDMLVQKMFECGIKKTKAADLEIRCAIRKFSIQNYYIDNYSSFFHENNESKQQKEAKSIQAQVLKAVVPHSTRHKKTKVKLVKKPTKEVKKENDGAIPSIMKVFGASNKPKAKNNMRDRGRPHKKLYPTSTTSSVSAISIPSGGMNKRY